MGAKYPSIMDNTGSNPGPGDYENPQTKTSQFLDTRNSKFGTSPRFSQPNLNPGVGSYEVTDKKGLINDKGTFGTGLRMVDKKNLPPGPNQYSHRSLFEYNKNISQGKTMSKKFEGAFNTNSETVDSYNNYFR